MGNHGLLFKGPLHYRSLIRMPFIWSDPARPANTRRSQLASAIDFAPTVLARAGVVPYHGLQGIDLGAAIRDELAATHDDVVIEEEGHRPLPGAASLPKVRSVLTQRWRLSVHAGETWGELYDLEQDPEEMCNRWSDPDALNVRAELLWRLVRRMAEYANNCPLPTRIA
jgi:arylsulfatase A-like enzyme